MSRIRVNIDGRETQGFRGQTVLEIAAQNGISIPTLCHDERVKMYGACGICSVELQGSPKLLRACSTMAEDGMVILTDTEKVKRSRKSVLDLLLSDHVGDCRPPCVTACPGHTDCQGYVGMIANGEYEQALRLIMEKIPLPGSIGRVCPHPCETACRRKMVEEPISIAALKAFAADKGRESGADFRPEMQPASGKRVAIIGGGPGGLSAAYFLRIHGHAATIFDAMPRMGGMLRYGIPEYRLAKDLLDQEIALIESMGVEMLNNIRIGKDLTLAYLRERYDAVMVAVGAWKSIGLRCDGETLDGVVGGIDFLRGAAMGDISYAGRSVAVVGGGNTAMDACRTAVRLGAENVYNIYRRTKNEMPAEQIEIEEAEQEGVIFKNLTNPIEILAGDDGRAAGVRLQVMELGEPDASGRRSPVPVQGKEETLEVDTVIVAIGQSLDVAGFEELALTKWGSIIADAATFRTSLEGVFAVGDATNNGADIAIAAIGEAKNAADIIDRYLAGEQASYSEDFIVTTDPTPEDFADIARQPRATATHRPGEERKDDFLPVTDGYTETEARYEASRCLECGCHDYFDCKLIQYARAYGADDVHYDGAAHERKAKPDDPLIIRDPDKCILCGLCVRVCDETVGATTLGIAGRGFDSIVSPALNEPLAKAGCVSCGMCVAVCPTGALTETMMINKQIPMTNLQTRTTCSFCSMGCGITLERNGGLLVKSLPAAENKENALLCKKGRFGFGVIGGSERVKTPLLRDGGPPSAASYEHACVSVNKRIQALQMRHGPESVAVAVSDRYTSQELAAIIDYARGVLRTDNIFSFGRVHSALGDVLGFDGSTADFDELESAGAILLVGCDLRQPHGVAALRVKRAVDRGAKLVTVNPFCSYSDEIAEIALATGDDLDVLMGLQRALLDLGYGEGLEGADALLADLERVSPSEDERAAAKLLAQEKHVIVVFEQNGITTQGAAAVANIAALLGDMESPRRGVIQLKPGANAQGLADLGIQSRERFVSGLENGDIRGLVVFGEDVPPSLLASLEFLAVQELHMTETAKRADVVLPASSFAESCGTFTSATGKLGQVRTAVDPPSGYSNIEIIDMLCAHADYEPRRTAGCACSKPMETRGDRKLQIKLARMENAMLLRDDIAANALVRSATAL